MRPTYDDLYYDIEDANASISHINHQIVDCDDADDESIAELNIQLDFYQHRVLLSEELMADTIDKGRGND